MDNRQKAVVSALSAVFPTIESFQDFKAKHENTGKTESFVYFAHSASVIKHRNIKSLETFIQQHSLSSEDCMAPRNLSLKELIENRKTLFDFKKSVSSLVYEINKEVGNHIPEMSRVSKSMFTRLKQGHSMTAHKENILRCFAFWLGLKRPDFKWNYEKILQLCRKNNHTDKEIYLKYFAEGNQDISLFLSALRKSQKYLEQAICIAEHIRQYQSDSKLHHFVSDSFTNTAVSPYKISEP